MALPQRTIVYVDGFNLYYRALKGTPFKWLDLKAAFSAVLGTQHRLVAINYYTARINGRFDPDAPTRQDAYLRAIQSHIPELSITYGHFLVHPKMARQATPPHATIRVLNSEEKGSDVNLAVHLVRDAYRNRYDAAFVVSNDSDLAEAVRLIRTDFPSKMIGLIVPGSSTRPAIELTRLCRPTLRLRSGVLRSSQLPDPIPGTTIRKPSSW